MPEPRTIAVLPFEELGAAPDAASAPELAPVAGWFARGITEDVITELSRFASLEVVHAHSSFASEARRSDRELGAELGARYVLRGTVRRGGERIVVGTRLVEAASGRLVAADRFESAARELPLLELDVAAHVAAALAIRLDEQALARARRKPVAQLEVYECWLRGLEHLRRGTREDDAAARRLFEHALALDPHFARAHAGLSLSHFNEWSCPAGQRWDETERAAFDAARRAVALDESDHVGQLILGRVHLFRREHAAARRRLELALALNPNDADALVQASLGVCLLGEPERALALVEKAKRLNPKHGDWYFAFELYPRFALEQYDEVVRLGALAPAFAVDLTAYAAAAAAQLGRAGEASARLAEFRADFRAKILFGAEPEVGEELRWLHHVNPYALPADAQRLERGLARAGLVPDPDAGARATAARDAHEAVFARDGDGWRISFGGGSVRLRDLKGFHDLALLLARPGTELHCLELAGRPAENGGESIDAECRRDLRRRARELEDELVEAREHADLARTEALATELAAIGDELASALGLGGRSRALGSAAEKARTAVTWRIRSAIRKLADAHPALGRHLENSVRTGSFCRYAPESPIAWRV